MFGCSSSHKRLAFCGFPKYTGGVFQSVEQLHFVNCPFPGDSSLTLGMTRIGDCLLTFGMTRKRGLFADVLKDKAGDYL